MNTYTQLSQQERYQLSALKQAGYNNNDIATFLGRHKSTISREVEQQIIIQPGAIRVEGHRVYLFCFGGCAWYYVVSSHSSPSYFSCAPSLDGVLTAGVQNWTDFQPLRSFAESYSIPAES